MKFVSFNDEGQIKHHFPEEIEFETVELSHGAVFQDAETMFVVVWMSTQNLDYYWSVTFSQIDGPMKTIEGELNLRGIPWEKCMAMLEEKVNEAFTEFTKSWVSCWLPK